VRYLVEEMATIARDTFPKSIQVAGRAPNDLWTVKGNTTELHQILLNLCVNARDAMPEGGRLIISAENVTVTKELAVAHDAAAGPHLMIAVSDTGTGIPPELRARIFEPFFTTKTPDKGTGLGLSTVSTIVKRHQGFMELETEVGKGSAFKIYLPATTAPEQPPAGAKAEPLPLGNGECVLLADDEISVLELGKDTLENYGYRVFTAANGLEAIACFDLHRGQIKLLVMDADMPFLDGVSALERIRKIDPTVPAIIASASTYNTTYISKLSTVHTLAKPYGVEDLVRAAASALGKV
jgi:two-component system cell cycle sensor histidine kinase/response regulator CckA